MLTAGSCSPLTHQNPCVSQTWEYQCFNKDYQYRSMGLSHFLTNIYPILIFSYHSKYDQIFMEYYYMTACGASKSVPQAVSRYEVRNWGLQLHEAPADLFLFCGWWQRVAPGSVFPWPPGAKSSSHQTWSSLKNHKKEGLILYSTTTEARM